MGTEAGIAAGARAGAEAGAGPGTDGRGQKPDAEEPDDERQNEKREPARAVGEQPLQSRVMLFRSRGDLEIRQNVFDAAVAHQHEGRLPRAGHGYLGTGFVAARRDGFRRQGRDSHEMARHVQL